MPVNESIKDWIRHERSRRRINTFYILLAIICIVAAIFATPAAIFFLLVVGIFAGMSNVCMLLGTPRIQGSDEEIRAAASSGPAWFQRVVAKMDQLD